MQRHTVGSVSIKDESGKNATGNLEFDWSSEKKIRVLHVCHARMKKSARSSAKQQGEEDGIIEKYSQLLKRFEATFFLPLPSSLLKLAI